MAPTIHSVAPRQITLSTFIAHSAAVVFVVAFWRHPETLSANYDAVLSDQSPEITTYVPVHRLCHLQVAASSSVDPMQAT